MSHDIAMCCGTLCNKNANLAYVQNLERQTELMRKTLIAIHHAVGDAELKLKPAELLLRIEVAASAQVQSEGRGHAPDPEALLEQQVALEKQFSCRRKP
ncbi:hypothetical protein [Aeromonas caviae]|uniref:Uncharacterized protein n=1 Tax=Aeromonas caviae TaxID=648 RepID=A0AAJ5ZER9_AERCA|nr:hypothetical protein [Aeromonas caviae]RWT77746.1 hypothetical protein DN604_07185 [Aeromonas caviae]WFG00291.1 hypothetical protein P5S46_21250 [Aeromonas caviae]